MALPGAVCFSESSTKKSLRTAPTQRPMFLVQPCLFWNSVCRPGWPLTHRFTCLRLPSARTKGSSVDMLYSFAKCSRLDLIFSLNALLRTPDLRWNSSNAQLLLSYCSSKGYNISWELGNEPNSFWKKAHIPVNGTQLGEDFVELHKLLQRSAFQNAKLYGPDIGQPRGKTVKLLRSFLKAGGEVIDSLTWHHYYLNGRVATKEDFLSSDVLDTFILSVQKILKVTKEMTPGKKVWLGETSSAYGGGAPLLSNTFAAGFMWLDKLGLSAQMGIEVVMRQVFFGAGNYHLVDENFEPLPVPRYQEGDLTLYVLNLHNVTKHLKLPSPLFSKPVDKYLLKPSGPDGVLSKICPAERSDPEDGG
ncbi:Heparanase [Apodemus speciosus]|uniref:Heparanase n=1 Tax=Apodemus speciosus TaxID=105296 RepID=A0ABQ0ES71_APOSI